MTRMIGRLAEWWYRLRGWRFEGSAPTVRKCVVIGAPHTANVDFLSFLAVATHFGLPARYIGKHTLFRWPFGGLMRRLGGIPVRRDSGQGLVEQVVEAIESVEEMALVIAPEGSRERADRWRSGFHHIARTAGVPIVCGFVDYQTRTLGLGPTIPATDDVTADMDQIRAFYSGKVGRRAGAETEPWLREESDDSPT